MLTKSFYGKEDAALTCKFTAELPGILKWSIEGRDRLVKRGYFVQPGSAKQAADELADLGSPIGAFLRQRCAVDPIYSTECGAMFDAWTAWCRDNGRDRPGTVQTFGRDLRAAVPGLNITQPRGEGGQRERYYQGVGLLPPPRSETSGKADDANDGVPHGRFPDDGNWQDDGSTPAW